MANDRWLIKQIADYQNGNTRFVDTGNELVVYGDDRAHVWQITVMDGFEPAVVSGTAIAYFIRSDGTTVIVNGEIDGNIVTFQLADECYAVVGYMVGYAKVTNSFGTITIAEKHFRVQEGSTDQIVDPGNAFPSVQALNSRMTYALSMVADIVARMEAVSQYATTLTQESYLTLTEDFEIYNESLTPRVTRAGAVVSLEGFVKNVSARKVDSTPVVVCYLPTWAWPKTDVSCVQQGSTYYVWWLRVNASDGSVTASRYRMGTTYPSIGAASQFPLTCSWVAADASLYADAVSDAEETLSEIVSDLINEIGGSEFEQLRTSVIAIAANDTQQNIDLSTISNQTDANSRAITDLQNRTIADENIVYEVVAMTSEEIAEACQ